MDTCASVTLVTLVLTVMWTLHFAVLTPVFMVAVCCKIRSLCVSATLTTLVCYALLYMYLYIAHM